MQPTHSYQIATTPKQWGWAGRKIFTYLKRAVRHYQMLRPNEHLGVAVSGGKDSLTLLIMLRTLSRVGAVKFRLSAIHVANTLCTSPPNQEVVRMTCQALDIPLHCTALNLANKPLTCFWCARQRRIALLHTAKEHNIQRLALGHHQDDLAQTVLLNLCMHGECSTMAPVQPLCGGKFLLVRPLLYVREAHIRAFVQQQNLTTQTCPAPYSGQRARMQNILQQLQTFCPQVNINLLRAAFDANQPQEDKTGDQ